MSDIREGILAELAEAGREINQAAARTTRAVDKLREAAGFAKADGMDPDQIMAAAGIADVARHTAITVIRDTPAAKIEDFPWAT